MRYLVYAALLPFVLSACAGQQMAAPTTGALSRARATSDQERLYVGTGAGSMYEFRTSDLALKKQFNVPECTPGIKIDTAGTLYLPDNCNETISVFPKGKIKPSFVFDDPKIYDPQDVAIAKNGDVWVDTGCCNTVSQPTRLMAFHPNEPASYRTVVFPGSAFGMAFDAEKNLYVAVQPTSNSGDVMQFSPGARSYTQLGLKGLTYPSGIAFDGAGNLVVYDRLLHEVLIYGKHKRNAQRTIDVGGSGLGAGGYIAFSSDGSQLYVSTTAANGYAVIDQFDYSSGTLIGSVGNGVSWVPTGVAVGAPR
jgi:DNA-binding beta-propeller fold protein YncE